MQAILSVLFYFFVFAFVQFSEQLWLSNFQVEDSTARFYFFYPLTGTEHGPQPFLTTRDRELVSVGGRQGRVPEPTNFEKSERG